MRNSKIKIEICGLGKKYNIFHQPGYIALRDVLISYLKGPFQILGARKKGLVLKEDLWALKDVSFEVKEGEVVGIIGRNGAGKTTLLKVLSRITHPTEGQIHLRGRVASLLEVGTGFHPELTGGENIYFNGAILGMKKREIERKFDEIVEFSGVEKFLDTPVKRFSSGMQVRLAFSVAAHLEPEILLIDEVLAVGDAQFQKKCLGKMKDVSKSGRTILFVSHNMNAIRNLCNRAILLEFGRLSMEDVPENVVTKYLGQNLTTDTLISCKELESRLEGAIKKSNPTIRFIELSLLNELNLPCNTFDSDRPVKVCITYECLVKVIDLRVVVQIVDEENRAILISQNTDDASQTDCYERKLGIYKSYCTIPPNTFGQKHFYITVHLINLKIEHLILNKIMMFDVIFRGYNMQHGEWVDTFIRPHLNWDTEYLHK